MGVASARWVRPILMMSSHWWALSASTSRKRCRAGTSSLWIAWATATWMAVGNMSLVDCPMLTWSLGWMGFFLSKRSPPVSSMARLLMTSLAFMFDEVPEPVW